MTVTRARWTRNLHVSLLLLANLAEIRFHAKGETGFSLQHFCPYVFTNLGYHSELIFTNVSVSSRGGPNSGGMPGYSAGISASAFYEQHRSAIRDTTLNPWTIPQHGAVKILRPWGVRPLNTCRAATLEDCMKFLGETYLLYSLRLIPKCLHMRPLVLVYACRSDPSPTEHMFLPFTSPRGRWSDMTSLSFEFSLSSGIQHVINDSVSMCSLGGSIRDPSRNRRSTLTFSSFITQRSSYILQGSF